MTDRPRLLWFTAVPSPYRVPAWNRLGRSADLTVVLTGRPHRNRPAWRTPADGAFTTVQLPSYLASSSSDSAATGLVRPKAVRTLLESNPTAVIVQGWGDLGSLLASRLARRRGVPVIGFYGSSRSTRTSNGVITMLRRRHLRRLDAVLSYGTETTDLLIEDGVEPARIATGFNTVDVSEVASSAQAKRLAHAPSAGPHQFVFVGQLIDRKGPDLVIRAMQDPRLRDAHLELVGDGPERRALERLASTLGVSARVRWSGLVAADAMSGVYARCQTLVMPSRREVWGLVANEALAAGAHAVVSSAAGCAADLATQPGVFTAAPTEAAVADAMVRSLGAWNGWIADPPMLAFGAGRLADDALRAVQIARQGPTY